MARLRLQQAEEAFRLEKEQMEAKEREEALERAEQQRREEEQRRREEEQHEEQRRRAEEQREDERRRKVNEMVRKRDLELRLRQEQQAAEYEEQLWDNTSRGKTASLRNTVVKSSGNVNVPVQVALPNNSVFHIV